MDLDLDLDWLFEYLDLCLALRVECLELDLDLDLGLKCLLTTLSNSFFKFLHFFHERQRVCGMKSQNVFNCA